MKEDKLPPAKIAFKNFKCKSFTFNSSTEYLNGTLPKDISLKIDTNPSVDIDNPNYFSLEFLLNLSSKDDVTSIKASFIGEFETDGNLNIDSDFLNSSFITVNAPAILFPFIRSYISTMTINAGLNPIVLPTINFANRINK